MGMREKARGLMGEAVAALWDGLVEAAKKGSKKLAGGRSEDEEARGRLIGWLIKRRGKPGGSAPAKGGKKKLKRKGYDRPGMASTDTDPGRTRRPETQRMYARTWHRPSGQESGNRPDRLIER